MAVGPDQAPSEILKTGEALATATIINNSAAPLGSIEVTDNKQDPGFVPPPAYLAAPWFIILSDFVVIFSQLPYLPWVFLPLNLDRGGLLEDMTVGGLIYQVAATIITLVVLVLATMSLFAGLPWPFLVISSTIIVIQVLYFIQGDETIIEVPAEDEHSLFRYEQWFFINGIATTTSGHRKALARLEEIFKRPIVGINNKSLGPLADLFECLIQRDLRWPTDDIRSGYQVVKTAVMNKNKSRIVLCAHSQGGIILSEIADQLLSDFSSTDLKRVEVYTFASAANHFSAPLDCNGSPPFGHVEHFAHDYDMVARFGVLWNVNKDQIVRRTRPGSAADDKSGSSKAVASASAPAPEVKTSRFAGRVFRQKASGHMINSHYLGKHNILDSKAAREHSQLSKYRNGGLPAGPKRS